MNDMSFSQCQIVSIGQNNKYFILNCSTKVPTEKNSLLNATLQVFVEKGLFEEINSVEKRGAILYVGGTISVTGKTICDVNNNNLMFNLLLTNKRRVDMGRRTYETKIVLFDVETNTLITTINPNTGRTEVICQYYNTESKKTNSRDIIVSIAPNKSSILQENAMFNCSGNLVIRQGNSKILPVLVADTFVKDIPLASEMIEFPDLQQEV